MLEEALRNEHQNPNETALAMLSFLQFELPAGGAAAEARFYKSLYGPLCERIFGPILGKADEYRHEYGGWLSVQTRWRPAPGSVATAADVSSQQRRHLGQNLASKTTSWESDPVVRLLATADTSTTTKGPIPPTLIEAISNETRFVGFSFPFLALPKATQEAWLALLDTSMGGQPVAVQISDNDSRLIGYLLRKHPEEQRELLLYRQKSAQKRDHRGHQTLQLSPRGFTSPTVVRQQPSTTTSKSTTSTGENELNPNIILSMLEYYLFVFIRYPLAAPTPKSTPTSRATSVRFPTRPREPFGDTVYNYLFRRYLRHFLPYVPAEDGRSIAFDSASATATSSELFLRIVITLWMESQNCITPTAKIVKSIQERQARAGVLQPISYDLNFSYDLVQQARHYEPPPVQVKRCLRDLVVHVDVDPKLSLLVQDDDLIAANRRRWCLSNAMTALQQPFYNYIRAAFRYASVHVTESPFFAALDSWLIWIEPWNVVSQPMKLGAQNIIGSVSGERKAAVSKRLIIPKPSSPSKYDPMWEPYIAANLYLYAVPLAIFLRRARELDFSANKFDRSIQIVKRVFRVFTPAVVDAISRHLTGFGKFSQLVRRHVEILGPYAPPTAMGLGGGPMSLSSCQPDMHGLLEEIHMQHMKKVRDLDVFEKAGAFIEGLFGKGVVSGEEKNLEELVERAKLIVQLPIDYEIVPRGGAPRTPSATVSKDGEERPARNEDGLLTEQGLEQIIRGTAKCDPADVSYRGEKLRSRVGSHELGILVDLTIWASDWLNKKFGFTTADTKSSIFCINLRFLADYRNLFFLCILFYLLPKFLRWFG